jgi:hypothetical protein
LAKNDSYLIYPAPENSDDFFAKGKKIQPYVMGLEASVQRYGAQME